MYGVSSSWAILGWHIHKQLSTKIAGERASVQAGSFGTTLEYYSKQRKRKGKNESHSLWACSAILQLPETPPWSSAERPRSRTAREAGSGRGKLN
jgi:hypothetical protein